MQGPQEQARRWRPWILAAVFALSAAGMLAFACERWGPRWFPRAATRWGWTPDMVIRAVIEDGGEGDAASARLLRFGVERVAGPLRSDDRRRRLRACVGLGAILRERRAGDAVRRQARSTLIALRTDADPLVRLMGARLLGFGEQAISGPDADMDAEDAAIALDDPHPLIAADAAQVLLYRTAATHAASPTVRAALERACAYRAGAGPHLELGQGYAHFNPVVLAMVEWMRDPDVAIDVAFAAPDELAVAERRVREAARQCLDQLDGAASRVDAAASRGAP